MSYIFETLRSLLSVKCLIATTILLSSGVVNAADTPSLEWELVNPFRFIHDDASIDELRRVFEGIEVGARTPAALERKLQEISDSAVDRERTERLKLCETVNFAQKEVCVREARVPYLGWFASLAENNHQKTCWDSSDKRFRTTGACKDYIFPKAHRIRLWISNSHVFQGSSPQWFLNGNVITHPIDCHPRYPKGTCIELSIKYDENATHRVEVAFSNPAAVLERSDISVKDKLIVGLGDSFASGEGNPDIPAQFGNGETDLDFILTFKKRQAPSKDKNTHVGWLDQRCHRSMYSYQFKAALHYALSNPQKAVTFLTYACAGATTDEIIDTRQNPNNETRGSVPIQLHALRNALMSGTGKPRDIDYVLLSTGGNDLGFAKYVAFIVATGWQRDLASKGVDAKDLEAAKPKIGEMLLNNESGNYIRLQRALLNNECPTKKQPNRKCFNVSGTKVNDSNIAAGESPLKIKTCGPGGPCDRILLTPYPSIMEEKKGVLCTATLKEFDIPFGPDSQRSRRIELVNENIFKPLRYAQTEDSRISALGWTLVTSQFKDYYGHGFCAQNNEHPLRRSEIFEMPLYRERRWTSFDPWDYRAYEKRQRWFRLPVDAKLTTDQMHVILKKFRLDLLMEDDTSNIMHPTAEGHAATALANYQAIMRLETMANGISNTARPQTDK